MSWSDIRRFFSGPTIEDLEAAIPIKAPPPELPTDRNVIASAAKQLLDEPVLELAFERLETRLYETWKASGAGGVAVREEAFRLHWAIEELRAEAAAHGGQRAGSAGFEPGRARTITDINRQ